MANEKRLIDANEALRMIENSRTDNPYFHGMARPIWELAHDSALSCVIACPTVDAVEVVHGRWIKTNKYDEDSSVQCSKCLMEFDYIDGVCYLVIGSELPNYCPNCGAKMDGDGNG